MFLTIVVFIAALLILVISHELGHFLMARRFGVKVLEFGFGIPPRIWSKKWGQTLVSLNLLPVGGFVRLLGEDEVNEKTLNDKHSFAVKPVWQRIIMVAAGVTMNLLLAVVLFYVVLSAQDFKARIPLLIPFNFAGVSQNNESAVIIGTVNPNSPAEQAGVKRGEQVVSVNGLSISDSQQLSDLTKQNLGQKVTLVLSNEQGEKKSVELTPRVNPPAGEGPLGIGMGTLTIANISYDQRLPAGIVHSYNLTTYSVAVLGEIISSAIKTKDLEPVSGAVVGPFGLADLTGEILKMENPLIPFLSFVALLSLNLAIINILPIPALDGGRIFFLLIEGIVGKKVRPSVERIIHAAGMVMLLALIVLVTFSDIKKIFF